MAFGNLKFDTLTTSDSKNTNTEKSIDTSYLFNGIAKNWMSATEPGSVGDSFNVSSTSDDGDGIHSVVLTNNMASAAHAAVTGMQDADMACLGESGRASTGYMVTLLQRADSLTRTNGDHFTALFGDLA
jgi:hypothetical protein